MNVSGWTDFSSASAASIERPDKTRAGCPVRIAVVENTRPASHQIKPRRLSIENTLLGLCGGPVPGLPLGMCPDVEKRVDED